MRSTIFLFAWGCNDFRYDLPYRGGNAAGDTAVADPSFAADIQPILDQHCAGCHPGQDALDLSTDAYTNLVNQPSQESDLDLVSCTAAGDTASGAGTGSPDDSYLVHKLLGDQDAAGGTGGQMPLGVSALTTTEIQTVENWITKGCTP